MALCIVGSEGLIRNCQPSLVTPEAILDKVCLSDPRGPFCKSRVDVLGL